MIMRKNLIHTISTLTILTISLSFSASIVLAFSIFGDNFTRIDKQGAVNIFVTYLTPNKKTTPTAHFDSLSIRIMSILESMISRKRVIFNMTTKKRATVVYGNSADHLITTGALLLLSNLYLREPKQYGFLSRVLTEQRSVFSNGSFP